MAMFWSDVPEGWDWVAIDEDREVWAYRMCPYLTDEWEYQPEDDCDDYAPRWITVLPEFVQLDWRNSLVRRPR